MQRTVQSAAFADPFQSYHPHHVQPTAYGAKRPFTNRPAISIQTQNTQPPNRTVPKLGPDNDVPTAVRQLLLSTRKLQDLLKQWSLNQASEEQVSDCYVEVGTGFNTVLRTFAWWGIDLSDIHSIPQELRTVLEQCLGEEPSQRALDAYSPQIRKVLYRLLKGLQAKQDAWKLAGGGSPLIGGPISPTM